ncbi:MAG: alpha-amylase family glycosyl hydrolase [Gammaproteobacteria bacterium]
MFLRKFVFIFLFIFFTIFNLPSKAFAAEQPTAVFHAFNQNYNEVEKFVCTLADQGYSHVQISPAQKSNPGKEWWNRYQPLDYGVIEGLGSEGDLKKLTDKAHSCNVQVVADVVFNHMANLDGKEGIEDISKFPHLTPSDFNTKSTTNPIKKPCDINYNDGNRTTEVNCWLGGLPDLKYTDNVKTIQKAHLKKLLNLGINGFRFDAAKHMPNEVVKEYIDYINQESQGNTWNYLEVIEDNDTKAEDYNRIAAVEDFLLYSSMKNAFTFGGDLRSLPSSSVNDPRTVTFGRNHDTILALNKFAMNPYNDITDSYLASAYVLARKDGTPLIFNEDNLNSPYINYGVKFRQIMIQREKEGKNVKENILRVINNPTVLLMERGGEGFFVENKGTDKFDIPALDLTLSNLEGCYRELRNNFTVTVENRNGKKFVTRWATPNRGGMEIYGRDALFFIREPINQCTD